MRDYSTYYDNNANDRMLEDADLLFDIQLESNEGFDVSIDTVDCKILIYNHLNDMSEEKEERVITCKKDIKIGKGSLVEFQDETYIVISEMDIHPTYLKGKMLRTNNFLKFKQNDVIYSVPAIITNTTSFMLGEKENKYYDVGDTKVSIVVGINDINKDDIKLMYRGMRFIYDINDEKISYRITYLSLFDKGLLKGTMTEELPIAEDDLINNIAFNEKFITIPADSSNYEISGSATLDSSTIQKYKITNNLIDETSDLFKYSLIKLDTNIPISLITTKGSGINYINLIGNRGAKGKFTLVATMKTNTAVVITKDITVG